MSSITLNEYSDKSFVIKGEDTIKFKDTLKEFGGKWNASLKDGSGWIFPNTQKTKLQKFLEVVNMHLKNKPLSDPVIVSNEELKIKDYTDKCFVLYGNTQPHKDKIKELGGKWNGNLKEGLKGWIFPMTKKKIVEDFIKKGVDDVVVDEDEVYYEADEEPPKPMVRLLKK